MSVELGVFARIFTRPTAAEVAAAVSEAGYTTVQLNLQCVGYPTVPAPDVAIDTAGIRGAFQAANIGVFGLSATYNMIHPDLDKRREGTTNAAALIEKAPALGAEIVTLCTGTRAGDAMWQRHADNDRPDAWRDLRQTLDELLPVAEQAGVRLGIEPESGNVVADAQRARRLLTELGDDARRIGIVMDPANLLTWDAALNQTEILTNAFEELGDHVVCLHAKDVVEGHGYCAAGTGLLNYDLVFGLHAKLPVPVPVIVQDVTAHDAVRVREFLLDHAEAGPR